MSVTLPASEFNKAVDFWLRNRLVVEPSTINGIPHAWQTRCEWNAERKRWEAKTLPGFVNDDEVEIPGPTGGKTLGADDSPAYPLTGTLFRPVETEAFPRFFRQLGVRAPGEEGDDTPRRKLMALEITLNQPRPSVGLRWQPRASGAIDLAPFLGPAPRTKPYLGLQTAWNEPPPHDLNWQIETGGSDPGIDTLRLATVYMLSQPKTETYPERGPDQTWQPFVKHYLFRNLSHRTQVDTNLVAQQAFTFFLGTIGAIAVQPVIDAITDDLARRDLLAAMRASNFRADGHFWSV